MKKSILLIWITAVLFFTSCNNNSSSNKENPQKSAAELKAELKEQEQNNPTDYISDSDVTLQPQTKKVQNGNLFHKAKYEDDGALIAGSFINKATLAKFKDIKVKIAFYSQTKTLIKEESYVIYEYVEPNSTKAFSFKIDELPSAYDSFTFVVTGATPVSL